MDPVDSSDIRHGAKIGRFVVEGQLGAGAMGVVYAAHDRELDRRIALKVLKGTGDQEALLRLQREGQAMARVTHPNVITVHEAGIQGRLVFLAQELLDGGSLRQWLDGKHSQREILDKFVAAGRGLAAAHAAGLVHRDFKPDNVLLGKDGRVRVSDFGLARSLAGLETVQARTIDPVGGTVQDIAKSPMATMTMTGAVMGTPLYMSPEQHRGEGADERSDQFSYSVALYQALYGDTPYPGKTVVALADAVIAGRMQPPPRSAKVSAHLRRVLLRGLATDPRKRYPSMDALLADLTHDPARKLRRIGVIALITLLIAGAVVGGYVVRAKTSAVEVPDQRTIAVLGFKNLSGDKSVEWMSSAVSELLANEMAKGDNVRVIPPADAQRARADLRLSNEATLPRGVLPKIRERLGSDVVIVGSYLQSGDQLTLTVVVEDLALGKSHRVEKKGAANEFAALLAQAGTEVREKLGITSLALAKKTLQVLPKNAEAARLYIEGNDAFRKFDLTTAKDRLIAATQKEPDFAPAYIVLSDVHAALFEGGDAKSAAKKALDNVNTLGNDQQLWVSGQAYERLGQPSQARDKYRQLFATSPKLDYGLAWLAVETADDLPATLAKVRRQLGADPRIDLIEAQAEIDKDNASRALKLAQGAATVAQKSGDSIGLANARRVEGAAQFSLGELGAAADAFEASRKIYDDARDEVHRLEVIELIAGVSLERGELDDAATNYDTVAKRRQGGQHELAARAWAAAAYATAQRGKIGDAEKLLKQADDNKAQDPIAIAQTDLAAAWITWAKGDADAALKRSEQCATRAVDVATRALCLELNGEIRADRADPAARKTLEDALASVETNPQRAGTLQLALASLDLDEGQWASAVGRAETVQIDAAKRGATSLEAHAWVVLARAHLGQDKSNDALEDVGHIKSDPQPLRLRVQYKLADGLAHAFSGEADYGKEKIEAARAETQKQTCVGLLLETRLARLQLEPALAPGTGLPTEERKAQLDAVVRDAKAGNFGRIVKLAEALNQDL